MSRALTIHGAYMSSEVFIKGLMGKIMGTKLKIETFALALLIFTNVSLSWAGTSFESFQTHSHLTLDISPSVEYSVQRNEVNGKVLGLKILFKGLEKQTLEKLILAQKSTKDPRTEKFSIKKSENNGLILSIAFKKDASRSGVEFFDYRSKAGDQFVLDYWVTKAAKSEKRKNQTVASKTKWKKRGIKRSNKFTGSNQTQPFCPNKINVKKDGFVMWNVYHKPFDYESYFGLTLADSKYQYPLVKIKDNENWGDRSKEIAHYRLAHKLYNEAKYALVLRTIKFFEQSYPNSDLIAELDFLRANTFIRLARFLRTNVYLEQAYQILRSLFIQSPKSERSQQAVAFLIQEYMRKKHYSRALEYSVLAAENADKNHKNHWYFRLANAESLYALSEYDRAERVYQAIIDQSRRDKEFRAVGAEAAFRIGEVFSVRKFWERAALSYKTAFDEYSEFKDKFPSAWFNLAEAHFRKNLYQDSQKIYQNYVNQFPNDVYVWAGMLRITEIDQINLGDRKDQEELFKKYENIVNENPYTPGAALAELRLSECTDKKQKAFFKKFFSDRKLEKLKSELVDFKDAELWFDLAEARFYNKIGNYSLAISRIEKYRHQIPKMNLGESFQNVFSDSVKKLIEGKRVTGRNLLLAVKKYAEFIPRPTSVAFDLIVAEAFLEANQHVDARKKLVALELKLSESTDDQKDLFHMLQARLLKKISKNPDVVMAELTKVRDNSPFFIDKYDMLAQSALWKGDARSAFTYDSKILDSPNEKKLSRKQAIEIAVRRLESARRFSEPKRLATIAERTLLKYGAQTEYPKLVLKIKEVYALALYDSKDYNGAFDALSRLLELNPDNPRRLEFEFKRAKSLVVLGRGDEASQAFRKIAQAPEEKQESDDLTSVWKKSAKAELDQLEWENQISNQLKDRRSFQ